MSKKQHQTLDRFFNVDETEKKSTQPPKPKKPSPRHFFEEKIKKLIEIARKDREISSGDNLLLLSVEYDSTTNKALMKFYDEKTHKVYFLHDRLGHKPYFLTDASVEEIRALSSKMRGRIENIENITKYDPINDKQVQLRKVIVSDPLAVGGKGGIRNLLGEKRSWEAWIPYHLNYIYDAKLWPSTYYDIICLLYTSPSPRDRG